ncbi:MAG: hypothetical protein AB7G39_03845 [Alphaproteobacteria bacterium]
MNAVFAALVLGGVLMADYLIEVASEVTSEVMLDTDAGAITEVASGPGSAIVDTMPQATLRWTR